MRSGRPNLTLSTQRVLATLVTVAVVALIGVLFGDSAGAALGIAAATGALLLFVTHFRKR